MAKFRTSLKTVKNWLALDRLKAIELGIPIDDLPPLRELRSKVLVQAQRFIVQQRIELIERVIKRSDELVKHANRCHRTISSNIELVEDAATVSRLRYYVMFGPVTRPAFDRYNLLFGSCAQ